MLTERDEKLDIAIDDAIYCAEPCITRQGVADILIERLRAHGYEIVKRNDKNE